ncbi:MAG: hypothetical protein WC054_01620 [Candidatus Nanopelagicales bacterium]
MPANTFAWLVGSGGAAEIRSEFVASQFVLTRYILVGLACAVLQVAGGLLFGHYRGRFDDFRSTCVNAAVASALGTIVMLLARPESTPKPVAINCGAIALAIMLAARTIHRNLRDRLTHSTEGAPPVILFGGR